MLADELLGRAEAATIGGHRTITPENFSNVDQQLWRVTCELSIGGPGVRTAVHERPDHDQAAVLQLKLRTMEMPESRTFGALLEEISARHPDRPAIIYEGATITYADLLSEADRASRTLLSLGVRRGDPVAALIGNQPEWVVMCFAAARIGAIFVPLNTWYRRSELGWSLRHMGAVALVSLDSFLGHDYAADFAELIPELSHSEPGQLRCEAFPDLASVTFIGARHPGAFGWDEFLELGRGVDAETLATATGSVTPEDLLYILYTSGSTAEPKGVTIRHRGAVENPFNIGERRGILADDRVWIGTPLFYGLGAVNAMPAAITHGSALVLQGHFTAARAISTIERERPTIFYGTSNIIRAIVDDPSYSRSRLNSLRGGSAGISPEERRILIEEIGAVEATPSYGLTESYGNATGGLPDDPLPIKLETSGKPLPGFEFRIIDPQTRRQVSAGESGLLLIRGYVTDTYFGNPAETARVIDSEGWFETGDIGQIDAEGYFRFESRSKEMIKSGGINISPMEVEQLLLRHPSIRQAYVVGVPDAARGEIVVAIVEAADKVSEDELRAYVKENAASFKTPRHFLFRTDDQIPRLATGKVPRFKLREEVIVELAERAGR